MPAGLTALADNGGPTSTHAVMPGSNAQDKVPPANCAPLTTDQRGYPRPSANSANCDEGAYELTTCDGAALNAPGGFPGCPPPTPPAGGGTNPTPQAGGPSPPPPVIPSKKCKKAKKGAASAKKCRRKK